ncbi:venom protease-like [Haemaphysalis longicornis]
MGWIKNKRVSRRAVNTKIISEVDQLLQSQQLDLSALRVFHGRLRASNAALSALNAELEAHLTDDQAAEDYASVMEYDDAATSALALLEHHMEVLKSSSTLQTAPPLDDASGDRRAATSTGPPIPPTHLRHVSKGSALFFVTLAGTAVLGPVLTRTTMIIVAAALFRYSVKILNFWCGGTLITRNVILSAAHCFHNSLRDTRYIARIGGVNLSYLTSERFIERHVASVHVHPDFDGWRHYGDVALLFLNQSVQLSPYMRPLPLACLPAAGSLPNESAATVIGWGHDKFGGRLQMVLQHARIPLVDTQSCERRYQGLSNYADKFPHGMKGDFICAGNTTSGGVDACQQDSGGPLVTKGQSFGRTFFEAIGVVSFGVGCGSASYPGVYTKVSNSVDWILNVIADALPDEGTRPIE